MTTPRPDQRHAPHTGGPGGSRSGSGDISAALSYPGVPPAVLNYQSAQALRKTIIGAGTFFTFTTTARIWMVLLAYTVNSFGTFTAPQVFAATVTTGLAPITLNVLELSLAANPDKAYDSKAVPYNGLPVIQGDSLILNINGGLVVTGANQEASAVVLFSTP